MNGFAQKPGSLGRPTRLMLYAVSLGVWFSGGLWLLLHTLYFKRGEFGPEVNPLEPWCLKVHGAFGFAAIWLLGLLWGAHMTRMWPLSWRRRSGGVMAGVAVWLILTGYLLYYVGDDKARSIVSVLHWGVGLASPLFFFWHRVSFRVRSAKLLPDAVWLRNFVHGRIAAAGGTSAVGPERVRGPIRSPVETDGGSTGTAG
jgi:hypothetical protein